MTNLTLDESSELAIAFSSRREFLLHAWIESPDYPDVATSNSYGRGWWAKRICKCNDAEHSLRIKLTTVLDE